MIGMSLSGSGEGVWMVGIGVGNASGIKEGSGIVGTSDVSSSTIMGVMLNISVKSLSGGDESPQPTITNVIIIARNINAMVFFITTLRS